MLLLFSLGNSADAFLLLRLSDALGSADLRAAPLVRPSRRQGVALDVGGSAVGPARAQARDRHRLAALRPRLRRLCNGGRAWTLVGWFLVYGAFFALTEGAEKALVADLAPADKQGMAFGSYNTTLGVGAWPQASCSACSTNDSAHRPRFLPAQCWRRARSRAADGTPALVPGW